MSQGVAADRWVNQVAPLVLTIGLATGFVRMFRINSLGIWTPLMWLRIVMIAYSGIGSIVPFFANTITLDQMDRFFTLYPGDMAKYNAVAAAFSLCALTAARFVAACHEMARSTSQDMVVIGIAMDYRSGKQVAQFVKQHGISYPVVLGNSKIVAQIGDLDVLPTSYLYSPAGEQVSSQAGEITQASVERFIKSHQ